jgi:tetratricopeptide (TPR) repeat protein
VTPRDYEGACALGRLLWISGSPERAVEPLQLSIQRNRTHGESRHALARVYLALAKPAEALAQAEAWASENPSSAAAQKDTALALAQQGKWKESEAALGRAMKLDAQDPESYRLRATVMFARGDGRAGFAALQKANTLAPKDSEVFCAIGRAFVRQGNVPQAQKAYEGGEPRGRGKRLRTGRRRPDQAGGGQAAALEAPGPSRPRRPGRATVLWPPWRPRASRSPRDGSQDAKHSAELAMELQPFLADAALAEGLVLRKLRDETKARELLIKAVQLDPADGPTPPGARRRLRCGG